MQWIEDQKQQIINNRKQSNQFNELSRKDAEKQREQRQNLKGIRTEMEKMEIEKNAKQMENVLKKETEIETERKLNRQNADFLSMFNQQEKHNSEYLFTPMDLMLYLNFSLSIEYVREISDEQKRINNYLEKKFHEESKRKYERMVKQRQRIAQCNQLATALFESFPDIEKRENECYQKAVKELQQKWDEQEEKKWEQIDRHKRDRIEYQTNEKDQMIKARNYQIQLHELEKEEQKMNEKLDFIFDRQQRLKKIDEIKSLREFIRKQIELDKRERHVGIIQNRNDTNRAIDRAIQNDDQTFFNYASKLLKNAKKKGYPLKPLIRTIDQYKTHNSLLPQRDDLPHLRSDIDIGISIRRKYSDKLISCNK